MSNSTPFESVHEKLGASFGEYNGWKMPSDFGDVAKERAAIYEASAAVDLSNFGRLQVKGTGAGEAIGKLIATNTDKLIDGSWIWAVVCCEAGTVVDIVRVACVNGNYMILTSPAKRQMVLELAQQCCEGDVKVDAVTEKTGMLGLYGPKAVKAVSRILPFDISELEPGGAMAMSFFMMPITIIRGSWLGVDGLELICPKSAAGMAGGAIAKYGDKEGVIPTGMEALESAMIEAGVPLSITNCAKGCKLSPQVLGLMSLVDMNKNFVGKDAITGASESGTSSQIIGIKTGKGKSHADLRLQYDDGQIGWSPMVVPSERLGCNIGLAIIEGEFARIDAEVQVVGDDIVAAGELVKLPFDESIAAGF